MTPEGWAALVIAAAAAVTDWWAVATGRKRVEYIAKPATLAALVVAALAVDPVDGAMRAWFVAAFVLSLAGDVFLMVEDRFVEGLASFLGGHLGFIAGFVAYGLEADRMLPAVVSVLVAIVVVGRPIVLGARREEPKLAGPVLLYMLAISAMVVTAAGSGIGLAVVGAGLFYCSDALIGWRRFVRPQPWHAVAIIVTYHLAQAALLGALV